MQKQYVFSGHYNVGLVILLTHNPPPHRSSTVPLRPQKSVQRLEPFSVGGENGVSLRPIALEALYTTTQRYSYL